MRDLPPNLWADSTLHLPDDLVEAHGRLLYELGLMDLATGPYRAEVFGGPGDRETHDHFAMRFGASCSRLGYVLLDPDENHEHIHHPLQQLFSVGRIVVVDTACGCGAMGLAALAYSASLRASARAPRLPLEVHLLGLDFSVSALSLYEQMLERLAPDLGDVGITATLTTRNCDLRDRFALARILEEWISKLDKFSGILLVVGDVSGNKVGKDDKFLAGIDYLYSRCYASCDGLRKAITIEPGAKREGLLKQITQLTPLTWFLHKEAKWYNPFLRIAHRLNVSAALIPYPSDEVAP